GRPVGRILRPGSRPGRRRGVRVDLAVLPEVRGHDGDGAERLPRAHARSHPQRLRSSREPRPRPPPGPTAWPLPCRRSPRRRWFASSTNASRTSPTWSSGLTKRTGLNLTNRPVRVRLDLNVGENEYLAEQLGDNRYEWIDHPGDLELQGYGYRWFRLG